MSETKVPDEMHKISRKRGNGVLRREIWIDNLGIVTRYNLAYINFLSSVVIMAGFWDTTINTVIIIGISWGRPSLLNLYRLKMLKLILKVSGCSFWQSAELCQGSA